VTRPAVVSSNGGMLEYLGKYVCDAPKSVSDEYRRFVGNCWFVMNR
jgi:hypothetical protein